MCFNSIGFLLKCKNPDACVLCCVLRSSTSACACVSVYVCVCVCVCVCPKPGAKRRHQEMLLNAVTATERHRAESNQFPSSKNQTLCSPPYNDRTCFGVLHKYFCL